MVLRNPPESVPTEPTPAPPATLWMSVATAVSASSGESGGGPSPQGSMFLFKMHAYSEPVNGTYPPFVTPTITNPAGVLPAAAGCTPGAWWNGTDCVHLIYTTPMYNELVRVLALRVAWRAMPPAAVTALEGAGCVSWNTSCIASLINKTAAASAAGLPTGLLSLRRGRAAARYAAASPSVRAATRRWVAGLAEAVEAGQPSAAAVSDAINAMYGNRFMAFASLTNARIGVVQMVPLGCDTTSDLGLLMSPTNVLSMMGNVRTLQITANAQFAFAAVARQRYFLSALERTVEVCNKLAVDPSNPFLSPLSDACTQNPRLPTTADFLQVAGACLPGMSCPSFAEEEVASMAAGDYTTFGFDRNVCEPGNICNDGRKSACPTGFACGEPGMSLPQVCGMDGGMSHTCYYAGSVEPTLCDNGTLCQTPYLPPIPAPPGYAQSGTDAARSLAPCSPGDYCNLGRSTWDASLLTPAGTFARDPAVLQPTVCNFGGACNASACPVMPLCLAGSTVEEPCPAGYYCPSNSEEAECSPGTLCIPGSPIWSLCPAGSYCPTASQRLPCPGGSYCPQGSVVPIECQQVAHCFCDGGCAEPPVSIVVTATGVLVLLMLVAYLAWHFWLRRLWHERQLRQRAARRARKAATRAAVSTALAPLVGANAVELVAKADAVSAASLAMPLPGEPSMSSINSDATSDAPAAPRRSAPRLTRRGASVRLTRKSYTIDISFDALGLQLKAGGRSVLNGVTGNLRHGRVCAVMGPSGAGKTTFLTALCGKASYGILSGDVRINGTPGLLTDRQYKHLVGFVPQEDIMMRDMTVEENIAYAALTRLPAAWPTEDKLAFADGVVDLLGLTDIRDSVIGDETVRGISGGQRKRVNIGIELAADPTVLFLDEPTSGLDATSSMEVCAALRRIADMGLTIALVLHQPRFEIFRTFDDLLLLGKGGKTVYQGAVSDALPYFEAALDLRCPERVNPADFMLDVVGGDVPREWRALHPDWTPASLFDAWVTEREARTAAAAAARAALTGAEAEGAEYLERLTRSRLPPAHDPISFPGLVFRVLRRSLLQQVRHPGIVALDNLLAMVSALFLAIVYFGTPSYSAPQPIEVFQGCPDAVAGACQVCLAEMGDSLLNRGVMTIIAISLTGVATFLRVFGPERVVYWREASALPQPRHTIAYFVGKDLAAVPQLLVGPLVFTMAYFALTTPRASFGEYYSVFFTVYWCASGFGYLTAILAPPSLAQLLGVTAIFGNAMFAGGQPTLPAMNNKFIPLRYLPNVSYMRWALEAAYVAEVNNYAEVVALQGLSLADMVNSNFGYLLTAFNRNIAIVFCIGILLRVGALVAMLLKDNDRKK